MAIIEKSTPLSTVNQSSTRLQCAMQSDFKSQPKLILYKLTIYSNKIRGAHRQWARGRGARFSTRAERAEIFFRAPPVKFVHPL